MAHDEGLAQILRDDLIDVAGISERNMFGGLCFMLNGNMLCGVSPKRRMFRVGKEREAEARAIDGAGPMNFTGRPMGGMIDVTEQAFQDDARRAQWLALSLTNSRSLPAK
ncbi:MAG: TfoX/Sxy family protein [Paracoccaceae bacterium]